MADTTLGLIDLAVIGAVAGILPTCLGHRRLWCCVSVAVAVSCAVGTSGVAVALAAVWPAVGSVVLRRLVLDAPSPVRCDRTSFVRMIAAGYAVVAALWFVASTAGVTPLGIHEPIVALTAVHFTYVGVAAVVLADDAVNRCVRPSSRVVGCAALVLTIAAPPAVAIGFTTGWALAQVGGAVVLSIGVFCTAALELHAARHRRGVVRLAFAISGLSVWAPMVLAVLWAAALHYHVPALSTTDMVRTHGIVNAVGFVGAGLVARHLDRDTRPVCADLTTAVVGQGAVTRTKV